MSVEHSREETFLLLRQEPHIPAVVSEAVNDDPQQYLAGERNKRAIFVAVWNHC